MFCTKCGKEIPDGTECDCTQQAQQQQPQQPPQQQQFQQPQQPQQQQFQQQPPPQQQQYQQPPQQQQFQQQPPPPQQPYQQPLQQQQFQQQPPPQQQYQQPPQQQQFQQQPPPQQPYQQPPQPNPYYNQAPADNRKLFSILAYIPLLFLIGMFSQNEKNDQRVRFHIGQGIILTIYWGACQVVTIIVNIILGLVWRKRYDWGWGVVTYGGMSTGASIISWILWLATYGSAAYLVIMAIMNINKNWETSDVYKPLPIIGKFAFFK